MKTPLYRLKEAFNLSDGHKLEKGSLVKIINACHVPEHVKDKNGWAWFNEETYAFVYTHKGMIVVSRSILELCDDRN